MREREKRRDGTTTTTTTWKWNNDRGSVPVVAIHRILCCLVFILTFFLHDNDDDGPTHMSLSLCGNRKLYLYWLNSLWHTLGIFKSKGRKIYIGRNFDENGTRKSLVEGRTRHEKHKTNASSIRGLKEKKSLGNPSNETESLEERRKKKKIHPQTECDLWQTK